MSEYAANDNLLICTCEPITGRLHVINLTAISNTLKRGIAFLHTLPFLSSKLQLGLAPPFIRILRRAVSEAIQFCEERSRKKEKHTHLLTTPEKENLKKIWSGDNTTESSVYRGKITGDIVNYKRERTYFNRMERE